MISVCLLLLILTVTTTECLLDRSKYITGKSGEFQNDIKAGNEKVYLILTKPRDELSIACIRQLLQFYNSDCHIYILCPSSSKVPPAIRCNENVSVYDFDPFGSSQKMRLSAMECIERIQQNGHQQIDGVLFQFYGSVGGSTPRKETGLLLMAEYKLISSATFFQCLLSKGLLKSGARIIFSGSESATNPAPA